MDINVLTEKDIYKLKIFFIYLDDNNIIEIEMVKIKINNNTLHKKDQINLLHKYQYLNEDKYKVIDIIYQSFEPNTLLTTENNKLKVKDIIEDIELQPTYSFLQEINGVYIFLKKIDTIKNIKFKNNKSKKRKIKI